MLHNTVQEGQLDSTHCHSLGHVSHHTSGPGHHHLPLPPNSFWLFSLLPASPHCPHSTQELETWENTCPCPKVPQGLRNPASPPATLASYDRSNTPWVFLPSVLACGVPSASGISHSGPHMTSVPRFYSQPSRKAVPNQPYLKLYTPDPWPQFLSLHSSKHVGHYITM